VAEEWNLRIDKEMKNLTGGLGELVELADVRFLSPHFLNSSYALPFSILHLFWSWRGIRYNG
jgi:hypothetical protein